MDTSEDISRKTRLATIAYNNLGEIFDDKKSNVNIKVRILDTLDRTIFMYKDRCFNGDS